MGRTLADLLGGIAATPFGGAPASLGVRPAGLTLDSRRVRPGWLFVAVDGGGARGSDFVAEALARGAVAVVLPEGRPAPRGIAGAWVGSPREALSSIAHRFYGRPSDAVRVAGVTGSNGKTTVAYMTAAALEAGGAACGRWTTNEVWSGSRRFRPILTSPEAPDLHRFLAEVRDAGMREACIEVSSHAVVQRRCDHVRFAHGLVTAVTPDHLDFHGTFAAYLEAKRGFVRLLRPPALCFYNVDDGGARAAAAAADPALAVPYGLSHGAAVRGLQLGLRRDGASCRVLIGGGPARACAPLAPWGGTAFDIAVPLPGVHNVQNALGAIGLALAMGGNPDAAARGIAGMDPPARRMHTRRIGPFTVIDDVAMNEASFDTVLAAIDAMRFPHIVVTVALRGNRGPDVNARIAAVLASWNRRTGFAPVEASLSRGTLRRYALDHHVRPDEVSAFACAARRGGLEVRLHDELDDAVGTAVARLRPGGALVLLGTFGMDDGPALAARLLGADAGDPRFPPPTEG